MKTLKFQTRPESIQIYADSERGIYIPQHFAQSAAEEWSISDQDRQVLLSGPENEHYWEVWDEVLDNCRLMLEYKGCLLSVRLMLTDNGDLLAYCEALMTEDEKSNLFAEA